MIMKCIIVDDEPLARDVLEQYVADCPLLESAGSCPSAFEAIELLKTGKTDLVFLDINMPKLSGISMIRSLDDPPEVIFTTAYPEYAVEGFELDAADYLVKPFSFERFMKAVNKVVRRKDMRRSGKPEPHEREGAGHLMIKSDGKLYKVELDRINYLEAFGDYVRIHLEEGTLVTHDTMKSMERLLPPDDFMRVHRSFVVAVKKIRYIEGNRIRIGSADIPVAATFKEALLKALDSSGKLP